MNLSCSLLLAATFCVAAKTAGGETIRPLKITRLPQTLAAGEVFSLQAVTPDTLKADDCRSMTLKFYDQDGREANVSVFARPSVRYNEPVRQLYVDLATTVYARPGRYRWKLVDAAGNEYRPEDAAANTLDLTPGALPDRVPTLRYGLPGADNIQHTAVGNQAPFLYATNTPKLQSYINWQLTGGHYHELYIPHTRYNADGTWDFKPTELEMMQILTADPNAAISLKIRLDMPGWWVAAHPDELYRNEQGQGNGQQSFCSQLQREQAKKFLVMVLDTLNARPVGRGIGSVMLLGMEGSEFQLYGQVTGAYDCSTPAREAFRRYQEKQQWTPVIDLPHPALKFPYQKGENYDLIRQRYFRFLADELADMLIDYAKFFREHYGDRYELGVYYGYPLEHASRVQRLVTSGHLGVGRVIREADFDFISSPDSYGLRRLPSGHAFMYPVDSVLLHHKRPLLENDIRNYIYHLTADGSGPTVLSLAESITTNLRLSLLAAAHGAFVRYYAIPWTEGDDFFAPLEMILSIRDHNELLQKLVRLPMGSPEEVVFTFDPMSLTRAAEISGGDEFLYHFTGQMRDTLPRTGRPVSYVIFDDLLENAKLWQRMVIALPGLLDPVQLAQLETVLKRKLPKPDLNSGALVITPQVIKLCNHLEEVWQLLATPEAGSSLTQAPIWYIGQNYCATWDGVRFVWQKKP